MQKQKRLPLPLDAQPQEKLDNLLLKFIEVWEDYGSQAVPCEWIEENFSVEDLGFYRSEELIFYLSTLIDKGLLSGIGREDYRWQEKGGKKKQRGEGKYLFYELLRLTFDGLNYGLALLNAGKNSFRCFVAMKYDDDTNSIYKEGIAKAVEDCGFRPIRVDMEHAENEQTINDFIIASIKQSRFCITDLTHQSRGAYFEAGYALGRGLPVIYTCRLDDFEQVHFDLKAMQIITYSSPEELRNALNLKIQAIILE